KVLWLYLKLVIWPWPLSIHYALPYLNKLSAAWPWLIATTLLAVATGILLWRRSPVGMIGAWILLILSPTSLVPVITEVAAERRMYLPLAAIITLAVVGGYGLMLRASPAVTTAVLNTQSSVTRQSTSLAVIAGPAILLALVCSMIDVHRVSAYHSAIDLWQNTIISQPNDSVAYYNCGVELASANRLQQAIEYYQQALQINPDYAEAHNNLGVAFVLTNQLSEAIQQFQQALRIKSDDAEAHNNFGNALAQLGQIQEAIEQFRQALQYNAYYADAHNNLGYALTMTGHLQEGLEQFQQAVQLKPKFPEAYYNLGNTLARLGEMQQAIEQYRQAIRLKPDYLEAYANLTNANAQLHRPTQAIEAAQKALELARSTGQSALARKMESWLTNYQATLSNQNQVPNQVNPNHQ
ncbi:MAG TPA: tetratricopeptide repeat protein, partial [Pirellulales bacterium]|nr:tetratricopeptide repeat protein [Pirellulales bacterium]